MTPCIATLTLSGDLPGKIAAAARAGFRSVELVEADFLASGLTAADLRARLAEAGLSLTALQPCRDVEGLTGVEHARSLARATRQLDMAAALGADMLLVCSQTRPDANPDRDAMARDLAELATLAAARGLRLGYEALSWGRHIATHSAAWDVIRRADHPNLGLVLDSFHTLATHTPYDDIADIPGGRIFLLQLSDAPRWNMDIVQLARHFRRLPCLGAHDLVGFMSAVAATGYDGPVSVEVFSDQLRATDAGQVAQDAALSLAALRRQMGRDAPPRLLPLLQAALDRQLGGQLPSVLGPGLPPLDHVVLTTPIARAPQAMLDAAAQCGVMWRDLPDLSFQGGPARLSQADCGDLRLFVAQDDGHGTAAPLPAPLAGFSLGSLCFACDDVAATAAALMGAGVALLPAPPDHVAMAGAQMGLSADEVARLTAAQVFLDADPGGRFRQIHLAQPVAGLWLSFAERRGDYRGIGQANAALWRAARQRAQVPGPTPGPPAPRP